ncbi:hypothetical protein LTR37_010529 [Vermiconidia calcicola]|uniref:Uncharacterized protein n=1 Tax=Vermiconidia calcicola TaxID=1690605 RepID=A0ACC3N5G9_9PEZI|nr:hypothetical protein LTR37_010529 [Vermiconidia calcicola]
MVKVLDHTGGKDTAGAVNAAFARLVSACIQQDLFHVLCQQHSEPFAIVGTRYSTPVYIERFAAQLFGITHRGAHLVAYTNTRQGMKIWIARRSRLLYTYPDMLDVTVAGGVKADMTPSETIIEEAAEEASIPSDVISGGIRSRGVISHISVTGDGFPGEQGLVVPDYIYTFDIELRLDVQPRPCDEEVAEFYCMSIGEVQKALLRSEFKPDSGAVLVDFLIRHGVITHENEKDFVDINMRLHRSLPFRTGHI